MKKLIFICMILLFSHICTAQENNLKDYRASVEFVNSNTEGTVTVSAVGIGKKRYESIQDAARNAFFTILFRGIPGSKYKSPLINNEAEFKNHPVIQEILNEGYVSFLSNSSLKSETKKSKKEDGVKGIETINNFTINYEALRKYLEQKKVIRKFGI